MVYKKALGFIIGLLLLFTVLFQNSIRAQIYSGFPYSNYGGLYGASAKYDSTSLYGGSPYSASATPSFLTTIGNDQRASFSASISSGIFHDSTIQVATSGASISPLPSTTIPLFDASISPLTAPKFLISGDTSPLSTISNRSSFDMSVGNAASISINFPVQTTFSGGTSPLSTIYNRTPLFTPYTSTASILFPPTTQISPLLSPYVLVGGDISSQQNPDSETVEGIEIASDEQTDPSTFINCDELRKKLMALRGLQDSSFYPEPTRPPGKVDSPPQIVGSSDIKEEDSYAVVGSEYNMIKNDGSYIYMIKDNSVRIIENLTMGTLRELSSINYDTMVFIPRHLYVQDDTLIVIGDVPQSNKLVGYSAGEVRHSSTFGASSLTALYIYTIEDRSQAKKEREIKFVGSYVESRIIGEYLYLIMDVSPPFLVDETVNLAVDLLPDYSDSAKYGEFEGELMCDCHEVMTFNGNTDFNYVIIATIPFHDNEQEIGRKVILGKAEHFLWSDRHLYLDVPSGLDSSVYQFTFEDGSVRYESHTTITGKIIDRFAMDEHNGYLRVAAITETSSEKNFVIYLYDEGMKLIETLDTIADDKTIYSVRFLGNKGFIQTSDVYPATSDRVNTMIMLSLEDPENPLVNGEVDTEGAFDCLYTYEDRFLLTLGSLITANNEARIQLSLFSMPTGELPTELYSEIISSRMNTMNLLNEHKSVLPTKETNLLALPGEFLLDTNGYQYPFEGALVFSLEENNFERKAAILHENIQKIIYSGEHFYTISDSKIKAINMITYAEEAMLELE